MLSPMASGSARLGDSCFCKTTANGEANLWKCQTESAIWVLLQRQQQSQSSSHSNIIVIIMLLWGIDRWQRRDGWKVHVPSICLLFIDSLMRVASLQLNNSNASVCNWRLPLLAVPVLIVADGARCFLTADLRWSYRLLYDWLPKDWVEHS